MPADTTSAGGPPGSLPYKTLSAINERYDGKLIDELDDLYEGGYRILKKSSKYLTKLPNEHPDHHKVRCATASYQPYFGQIVDQFISDLFGQPLDVKPAADADNPKTPGEEPDKEFYADFAKDADRAGDPFVDLVKCAMRTALVQQRAFVAIDAPPADGAIPQTRADEDAQGLRRCYAYEVPVCQVIDWAEDDTGALAWAVLHTKEAPRKSPLVARDTATETFTIWSMTGPEKDGKPTAAWARYALTYNPKEKQVIPDDEPVKLDDAGTTSFRRLPILRLELPAGLWVGNKIGPQAREHWQRRSAFVSSMSRSLVAVAVVNLGSEIGAAGGELPSEVQQDPNRGNNAGREWERKGAVVLGKDDKFSFAEPDGHAYEITSKELENLRQAMFAVNHQMAASVAPTPGMLGRSGLSKQKDGESTAKVLRALGHEARQFANRIYDTISEARDEDVVWTPHGLDTYEVDDRDSVLKEAAQMDLVNIPSVTFKRAYKFAMAQKLMPGADPATLTQIKTEIEAGVDAEEEIRVLAQEAKKDQIENPLPPPAGGFGAKKPPPPKGVGAGA